MPALPLLPLFLALQAPERFAWTETAPLPAERVHFTPGWTAERYFTLQVHASRDCWTARQTQEGGLAAWTLARNAGFSDSRWSNPVVSIGPRVYAFGHWGQARTALVGPDGALSKWKNAMPEQGMGGAKEPLLWGGGAAGETGRLRVLYHAGGFEYEGENFTNPRSQNKVFYALVRPDGLLSDWKPTTRLPYHPMGPSVVFHDGRLFVFGGRGGRFGVGDAVDGMIDDVHSAPANPDGTLGKWTRLERRLPWKGCGIAAFVRGGLLYVIGGETQGDGAGTATAFTDRCARAPLTGGLLGDWEELPRLPAPTGKTPSGFIGDWFYIAGRSVGGRTPVYSVRIPK
jgi:hypothetical protein